MLIKCLSPPSFKPLFLTVYKEECHTVRQEVKWFKIFRLQTPQSCQEEGIIGTSFIPAASLEVLLFI